MPENLNLGSGYTLRVTALDPSTGALVAGVNVGLEVITGTSSDPTGGGAFTAGPYMLVPGPNDWTNVLLALIAATPGIIAAIYAGRVHSQVKTPSGKPLGAVVEYAHDTVIANNMLLSNANGPTKRAAPGVLHEEGRTPPQVPDPPPAPASGDS
jgi:hypothetical protein